MPSVSRDQHEAMKMADAGKSNLGIPKKVGKDFLAADKRAGKYQKRQNRRKRLKTGS